MPEEGTVQPVAPTRRRGWLSSRRAAISVAVAIALLMAAVAAWPAAPGSPRYTAVPDACALVSAADIGRYAPGAQEFPASVFVAAGIASGSCSWSAGSTSIAVEVTLRPSAADAAHAIAASRHMQDIAGLGDRAVAYLTASGNIGVADVTVQTRNATVDLSYSSPSGRFDEPAVGSAATALARGALAALPAAPAAHLNAAGFPASARPGTPYARPASACALVRPASLDGSLAGASVDTAESASLTAGSSETADCRWTAAGGMLTVDVAVLGPETAAPCPSPSAAAAFGEPVIRECTPATITGGTLVANRGGTVQQIAGLGDQATAYVAAPGGPPSVWLSVTSGNAVVTVDMSWTARPTPAAQQVAESTAIARDVLAALLRSA